ncbi:hypothetical protein [Sinorhizobium terangae]|uniref:Uncharacterized protein n=1 Tax=Sinorhizobium terangae TaxID=110322 RepID=A0A6N7LKT4_SINTE|nr:hypothetical protein [Sinorhizobium terangae]MBB4186573.1 hypothetical protein [Sinorhizobium terangae]MQX17859.1 hypothetical protein [Sinorhizobium terangae]WFU50806.1 hypothetical protein QA637_19500 [Sinorhizobium terangae]
MIVVVEGISAAGKTTWCRNHAERLLVRESYPSPRPDRNADAMKAAQAWTDWNARRWADALATEEERGVAVCDTDPLKLHFIWGLWRIGEAPKEHWLYQLEETREAFRRKVLGFADIYLVKRIDPATARRQRDGDTERDRSNFDLHARLQASLHAWYEAIAGCVPAKVEWALPCGLPAGRCIGTKAHRYDVDLFDRFVASLPKG